jgi:hypothetical protein
MTGSAPTKCSDWTRRGPWHTPPSATCRRPDLARSGADMLPGQACPRHQNLWAPSGASSAQPGCVQRAINAQRSGSVLAADGAAVADSLAPLRERHRAGRSAVLAQRAQATTLGAPPVVRAVGHVAGLGATSLGWLRRRVCFGLAGRRHPVRVGAAGFFRAQMLLNPVLQLWLSQVRALQVMLEVARALLVAGQAQKRLA